VLKMHVSFESQIVNMYWVIHSSEFPLNTLQEYFSDAARAVIEKKSERYLRLHRDKVAAQIKNVATEKFESLGVKLRSVRIGDIQSI
jgi:uncharacterized membrane protein YqiK